MKSSHCSSGSNGPKNDRSPEPQQGRGLCITFPFFYPLYSGILIPALNEQKIMLSQEYISALAILLVSILKGLGVNIGNDEIISILTGVLALWVAVRRYQKGDIKMSGVRK